MLLYNRQKMELEEEIRTTEIKMDVFEKTCVDLRGEIEELEMSKVGLEGEISSFREEVGQMEQVNCDLRDRIEQLEGVLEQNRDVVSRLEELKLLHEEKERGMGVEIDELREALETIAVEKESLVGKLSLIHI